MQAFMMFVGEYLCLLVYKIGMKCDTRMKSEAFIERITAKRKGRKIKINRF